MRTKDQLTPDQEELLALSLNGGRFRQYAASCLLSQFGVWSECHYWMLISAMTREDLRCARMYLRDWQAQQRKPSAQVSKFIPGDHYHALNERFDTLDEAIAYLSRRGYRYGGLFEKYQPKYEE